MSPSNSPSRKRPAKPGQRGYGGGDAAERLRAGRPKWLPYEGPGNRQVAPEKWSMSATQFHGFLAACHFEEEATPKTVNMYDVCDYFVKPWTAGTGNSVALLLNGSSPQTAQLMISHAWGEETAECGEALMLHFTRYNILEDSACWFCLFSIYQPGDDFSIQEQLALDPFGRVLSAINEGGQSGFDDGQGMVVIHTSTSEVYERLWCVFEIGKASLEGVPIKAACSFMYIIAQSKKSKDSLKVLTENAKCSVAADEAWIQQLVLSDFGGAEMLNDTIYNFRMSMMRQMGYELRNGQWHAIPNTSFYRKGKDAAAELLELRTRSLRRLQSATSELAGG